MRGMKKPNYQRPSPEVVGPRRVRAGINGTAWRVIVTPDCQLPYEDEAAMGAVEQYVRDQKFDQWIDLGDFLDLDFASKHNEGLQESNAGRKFSEDFEYGRKVIDRRLGALRRGNKAAGMVMLEGNHEWRAEAYMDKHPEARGLVDVAKGLELADRGIEWVRCWDAGTLYKIGDAHFTHGNYTTSGHAKKMVESYCVNIFYGHTHDVQQWSKVMHGRGKVVVGQSLGCLCRPDLSYIGNNPKNWQLAFAEFWFLPSGRFHYSVTRIFDNKFVAPNGKVYGG